MEKFNKKFKPTSWSIDNKTSIYVLAVIVTILGISTYNSLPKEQFPDIVIPTMYVSTVYPGTSPTDMENLVTRPLEKQIKSISGVKKITSNSLQDFSNVIVEFNTGVVIAEAKQKVKDAVDKARTDLPSDLPHDPNVIEIDFSEFPMMNINLSGDFELDKLKKYADELKDRIEEQKEITRVDIVGALDHEIQIDADMYKMEASKVTMNDIQQAIGYENVIISGGQIPMTGMKRNIKVNGEFTGMADIENLIIKSATGAPVYLKDVADVKYAYKEKESFARLDKKNVITLNVIKRSGQNLINASDKIRKTLADLQKNKFPPQLKISLTGDQSTKTRDTLNDLINSIIIGFILVTLVLMFFMGITNAFFVALSVPLSVFIAFLLMPTIGFNLNMIVLFSLLFALGIIVDDAIVVIENTHRIFNKSRMSVSQSAKFAAGEVFVPVFAGTLTTLAPFIPLAFWPGIVGKFMFYLPITLILTLIASLIVAFIFNPVFAVSFMKMKDDEENSQVRKSNKGLFITTGIFLLFAAIFYVFGNIGLGNFIIFLLLLVYINKYVLTGLVSGFQKKTIPAMLNGYGKLITWALKGARPAMLLGGTFVLLILSIFLVAVRAPQVVFFPSGDPTFIYTYIKLPIGTDQRVTDSVTRIIESKVYKVLGKDNPMVDAVITNVAIGAGDPQSGDRSTSSNKGKVSVAFKEFQYRNGKSTADYLDKIRNEVKGMPGVVISVEQEQNGPPTGKAINIEVAGDDLNDLIATSRSLKYYLDSLQVPGVEKLKSDIEPNNPEVAINIDRERARREGLSTGQIGMEIRTAVFGKEASKYREYEDQYPIMVRYNPEQRKNIDGLLNLKITYRDMNSGQIRQIPLSAVASVGYDNSVGSITRKNLKRVITLSSNVLTGFTPNEVNSSIMNAVKNFKTKDGIEIRQTGESEDQKETSDFLGVALMISLGLIFLILVTQFNSVSKPLIILSEILFSIIGVLLGFAIFKMRISIVMTGMGIVGLAGIVVKNGILLVEFTDELKARGLKTRQAIIQAGKTRLTPVLLTAGATILGLVPLAIGFNINFVTLFTEFNPHIYIGGDSVVFWGPLAWTIVYGLSFATFLTLILVPAMYLIAYKAKIKVRRLRSKYLPAPVAPKPRAVQLVEEPVEVLF